MDFFFEKIGWEGRFGQNLEEDMEGFVWGSIWGLNPALGRGDTASGLEEVKIQAREG